MCRIFSHEAIERNGTMGIRLCMECWNDVVQEAALKYERRRGGEAEHRAGREATPRECPGKSVPLLRPMMDNSF